MSRRNRGLGAVLVVIACLAASGIAFAGTRVTGTTHTSATISYRSGPYGVTVQRLKITLDGRELYDRRVTSRFCDPCDPNPFIARGKVMRVLDLAGDGQLEVLVSLDTGGAHCCTVEQVYVADPNHSGYTKHEQEFQGGAEVTDIGHKGRFEFLSADPRFAYEFSDYAHSGLPIQIWKFSGGRFRTVTGRYPNLIRADAAKWMRAFDHSISNGVGLIAAWAADESRLGRSALVSSTLDGLARRGRLRAGDPSYASGRAFVRQLERFLRRTRYTR